MIEVDEEGSGIVDGAMRLARKKLVAHDDIFKTKHSRIAMLAILDVLITIDFEPRRETAHEEQMEMVSSHMRTAFSIPDHRLYFRSGYPSEPFLAEAASRQMYHYMHKGSQSMISILTENLDSGLIDLGQKGEVVMRVLLRSAYMDAIVAEQTDASSQDPQPNFSKGCSFLQFLKALFSNIHHTSILKAQPDNEVEQCTLEGAFKDAIVRFTHFVKARDDSVVSTNAMAPGFLRGSAFICHNRQKDIDIIIPILLDKCDTVAESSMSALLIQVKRQKTAGHLNLYIIDQKTLDFFPKVSSVGKSLRPYVTLVAELGVTSPSLHIDRTAPRSSPRSTSGKVKEKHPRYSLRVYGCTSTTWKAIGGDTHDDYKQVLGMDDFFKDHPRKDEDSLRLVRQMMPFWYQDTAWFSDKRELTGAVTGGDGTGQPMDVDDE